MAFNVQALSLPLREPVLVSEMKAHLTIDPAFTNDDALLADMIAAARSAAEQVLGRTLVPRRWLFARDQFPAFRHTDMAPSRTDYDALGNYNFAGLRWNDSQAIVLPQPPLLAVNAVRYADLSGVVQTLDPSTYQVDSISQPGRLLPQAGAYWPQTAPVANAVQIDFTAGYALTIPAETVIVPAAPGPYTAQVLQGRYFLAVVSVTDNATGAPVAATHYSASSAGTLTFDASQAGRSLAVTYQALSVPETVLQAIRMRAATYYANREEFVGGVASAAIPTWFEEMLAEGAGRASLFGYTGRL